MPQCLKFPCGRRRLRKTRKNETLGPYLETPFLLGHGPETPLRKLFVDAILWGSDGDIAIHNVTGGIRANLPAGELTFGNVYEVFPFDNVTVILDISGRDLRRIVAKQAHNHRRRAGIAGMRVFVECSDGVMSIDMLLNDGRSIADDDMIEVITNDFLALGGDDILTPAAPDGGFVFTGRFAANTRQPCCLVSGTGKPDECCKFSKRRQAPVESAGGPA